MNKIAQFLSFIFSPLLVPTYGVCLALHTTVLSVLPFNVLWGVPLVTFVITCILPLLAILGMWKLGQVKEPGLNERTDRTGPYVVTAVCYILCALYLNMANAPGWLVLFMAGGTLATVVSLIVNRWWKISAHMAAMGGLLALTVRVAMSDFATSDMIWWIIGVILCCGLVGTARLILERHTLWQVIAGAANGFVCVMLMSLI
ncbi:MAG: hypothetical protein NC043_00190 [Muribaculaceae bacterium]|nr:hypothetical protein [Muribaculaceae bacterium]